MNFKWKKEYVKYSECKSSFMIFETETNGIAIKLYLYITSNLDQTADKRIIFSRIYFKTFNKNNVESNFHDVSDDIFELCRHYLDENESISNISFNEYYLVGRFPKFIPFTFGDYTFN